MSGRVCRACDHAGPLQDFVRNSRSKDGRGSLCHECNRRKVREWTQNNRERSAARAREWARANPERKAATDRAWVEANRDRANQSSRDWAAKNRDLRREIVKRSATKHADRRRARMREYMASLDPEVKRARQREWKKRNRDKVALDNHRRRSTGDVDEPMYRAYARVLQGDPCSYCGAKASAIDHIVPLGGGGSNEWPNLTGACTSCNSSKGARPLLLWLVAR